MYSIRFTSNQPHAANHETTFLEYLQKLGLGRIYRIQRIPLENGVHFFVHFAWFGDETLRKQLDAGVHKVLFIWPNGNPSRGTSFTVHKTSVPSDIMYGLPVPYDCQIV
jgi:hypothetical protein